MEKPRFAEKREGDGSIVTIFYDVKTGRAVRLTHDKPLNLQPLDYQETKLTDSIAKYLFISPLEEQKGSNLPTSTVDIYYEGSYTGKESAVKYEIFHLMGNGKEVLVAIGGGRTVMKTIAEFQSFEALDEEKGTLEIYIEADELSSIDVAEYFNNENL